MSSREDEELSLNLGEDVPETVTTDPASAEEERIMRMLTMLSSSLNPTKGQRNLVTNPQKKQKLQEERCIHKWILFPTS